MFNKKLVYEITFILLGAAVLAFAYNYLSPKGISIIPKDKSVSNASDSLLFSSTIIKKDSANPVAEPVTTPNQEVKAAETKESAPKEEKTKESTAPTQNTGNVKPVENKPVEQTPVKPEIIEIKTITLEQMKKIADNPAGFTIVDARRAEEFAKGKIPGAINIFPDEENLPVYLSKLSALDRNKKIVIYCTGGHCELSHKVAEDLKNANFKNLFIFIGGWEEWTKTK